jgi:integrase/recombinase XerD
MSTLRQALDDYLVLRRSLGYKLERAGRLLSDFVGHLEACGARSITVDAALRWAKQPSDASPYWWAQRLSMVRLFARHLHVLDPAHEVPPAGLLPARTLRATPYLYTSTDIAALMAAARSLRSPLRVVTFETLIGLLAVTGLRIGEALRLDREDVDLDGGALQILDTKFGKSREVPLHASTVDALVRYARTRDRLCRRPVVPAFFISTAGTRLLYCNVHSTWLKLVREAGLERRSAWCRPRPHDMRHSFALTTLLGWYEDGADVQARMPELSTYLEHVAPASTYWYLSGAPELLNLVAARLEAHPGEPL